MRGRVPNAKVDPDLPGVQKVDRMVYVDARFELDDATLARLRGYVRSEGPRVCVRVEVPGAARPPNPSVIKVIREELLDPRKVAAVAFVHVGTGWRARMIRGVLKTLCATQGALPARTFDSLAAAQGWLDAVLQGRASGEAGDVTHPRVA